MSIYNISTCKVLRADTKQALMSIDKEYFDWPWTDGVWNEFVLDERHHLSLATCDGQVVGFSLYLISPLENLAHLLKVIVTPNFRGKGVGKAIMLEDIDAFKLSGVNKIYLEVSSENVSAKGLYSSLGFEKCRCAKNFYGTGFHADTMLKEF